MTEVLIYAKVNALFHCERKLQRKALPFYWDHCEEW